MSDLGWSKLVEGEEAENESACYEAAQKAGVANRESADECDDGECCCQECPWKDTAKNWKKILPLISSMVPAFKS